MARPSKAYWLAISLMMGLAAYLTWAHWAAMPVVCPATGLVDCAAVLTGPGSLVLGLPLAAWGGLWAVGGWLWPFYAPRLRGIWMLMGGMGLVWAWVHEGLDRHLCLWCSGMQLGAFVALAALVPWPGLVARFRRGWHTMPRRAWLWGGMAGLVSVASIVGYQIWLGTDTWRVVGLLALLWSIASAWLTALVGSRSVWRRGAAGAVGLAAPVTLAAGLGTTACAASVCAGGLSTAAAAGSAGFGGVLVGLFGVFAPMALQGLIGMFGLGVAAVWTLRRGGP
ncbi:MAG: hypothetical protein C7B45_06740 [Sulfobacillus acidophilus]|uniref:Vitamin K epoxide reductase domain-containing protein n=1 Tax=Sulfobacillus acidophilus TaxID=53633 RepID=A0A2T2WJK7_9FIRM|nr:MAG: hypothetical protein C7B45_06740 [Sulfobacillus acidophilus]